MRIVIGISGASGSVYTKKLIEYLNGAHELFVVASQNAKNIFAQETGLNFYSFIKTKKVHLFENNQMNSPLSSGSFITDACIIIPCSMKTLSSIANGYSDTLISRCADISIKEQRKLILAPREMPLSAIHLENMLKLARLGVSIVIPSPPFYNHPKTVDDLVSSVVGRVLDLLKIKNNIYERWRI